MSLRRKSDDFHFCGGSVLSANSIVTGLVIVAIVNIVITIIRQLLSLYMTIVKPAAHCTEIWDSPGEVQILAGGHNNVSVCHQ